MNWFSTLGSRYHPILDPYEKCSVLRTQTVLDKQPSSLIGSSHEVHKVNRTAMIRIQSHPASHPPYQHG